MLDKIISYLAQALDISPDDLDADTTFESLNLGSLDMAEMIMDLETELGVELEMEDENITNFQELADFIEAKLA